MPISRRNLIKTGLGAGALLSLPIPFSSALADTGDYKALVCIFLQGGNDAYNMVIPLDTPTYQQYYDRRPKIAISQDSLINIDIKTDNGINIGLHPSMSSLKAAFVENNMIIIVNTGHLVEPVLGQASYRIPDFLFDHAGQQEMWQSGTLNKYDQQGWVGRMMDSMNTMPSQLSSLITLGGQQKLLNSLLYSQLELSNNGASNYHVEHHESMLRHFSQTYNNVFMQQYSDHTKMLFDNNSALLSLLEGACNTIDYPDTELGKSLSMVAKLIQLRFQLGHTRQVYFVSMGGFDTHDNQLNRHADLLSELSLGMHYFYCDLRHQQLLDNVTTFTLSDFGRGIRANNQGTDHGWAGHQLVMGGAVNGGKAYGNWPDLTEGGPYEYGNGRIIPEISADQVCASLASWFGYPYDLATLFPSLNNGFTHHTINFLKYS